MSDDKKLKNAKAVYNTLCKMLDGKNVRYDKHPEDLVITFTMRGDDLPMYFILNIDAKRDLIRLVSPIPVVFEGDKLLEGAIATSQANYYMADGSFDIDLKTGKVYFRMTSSYLDSLISEELFEYMVAVAGYTIDEYNDKFLMLSKGNISIKEFFKK